MNPEYPLVNGELDLEQQRRLQARQDSDFAKGLRDERPEANVMGHDVAVQNVDVPKGVDVSDNKPSEQVVPQETVPEAPVESGSVPESQSNESAPKVEEPAPAS